MESGIENLASFWEATVTIVEPVIVEEPKSIEDNVEDTKVVEPEVSEKTLEETVYDKSIEEEKTQKQKELDDEIAKYKIPDIEEEAEENEKETENTVDPIADYIEEKSIEEEVKEVVEEIHNEKDSDLQKKQWESLLVSLREDIVSLKASLKEKQIENKTLTKRQEELIEEVNELKYSWRIKLDDEMEHLNYLKQKLSKKPDDKETQKQIALYHAKALNWIYPEYDIQESFNQINDRRKKAISALSWGSEGYSQDRVVTKVKPNFAAHWVAVRK